MMSALAIFLILALAGILIICLGTHVRGLLKVLSVVGGIAAVIIGLYGIFTYFL